MISLNTLRCISIKKNKILTLKNNNEYIITVTTLLTFGLEMIQFEMLPVRKQNPYILLGNTSARFSCQLRLRMLPCLSFSPRIRINLKQILAYLSRV